MTRTFSRQCPQCTQLVTWPDTATYPFCSERCRLLDLGAWADGDYRLPGEAVAEEELEQQLDQLDSDEDC